MMDMGLQLLRVSASLALVIAFLFVGLYGLKRWGQWVKTSNTNAWIQVLAQHSFGPKHGLVVVKVQEQTFLMGMSPQGIQLLTPLAHEPAASPLTPKGPESR